MKYCYLQQQPLSDVLNIFYVGFLSQTFVIHRKGKGEAYITPLYRFYLLHRHLDISLVVNAESALLHIASSRTRAGNL